MSKVKEDSKVKLDKVLSQQEKVRAVTQQLEELEAAITAQEKIISASENHVNVLPTLMTKREDLLAELLTGGASQEDLDSLDRKITAEKERLSQLAKETADTVPNTKQAVAGLRRKHEALAAELTALQEQKPKAIVEFLKATAEELGTDYVETAQDLIKKHNTLRAYGRLLSKFGSPAADPAADLDIPVFRFLEAHQGCSGRRDPARFAVPGVEALAKAVEEETIKISELGVEW